LGKGFFNDNDMKKSEPSEQGLAQAQIILEMWLK
jgi:hypothetical protein